MIRVLPFTPPAPTRPGCGRWMAPVSCGPIPLARACSAPATAPHSPPLRCTRPTRPRLTTYAAPRLERLRGFGAALGTLTTCACSRLEFSDGSAALLIVTAEPVPRPMPLVERLQCLVEGIDTPIASFAPDGLFIGASAAAQTLTGFRDLSSGTMDAARQRAAHRLPVIWARTRRRCRSILA